MRIHPLLLSALILVFCLASTAAADEVILKTGSVFTGTIESETDTHVAIRTDLGLMTIPKSKIEKVSRGSGGGSAETPTSEQPAVAPGKAWKVVGLDPKIVPAVAGNRVFAVMKDGQLAAFNLIGAGSQKPVWVAAEGAGAITGITADPGGVYLITKDGRAARVYPGSGKTVWRANPGGRFAGAPVLLRRGLFAFQPNRGLMGIETATGEVRGLLEIPVLPNTPLAVAGDSIVFGEKSGRLLSVGKKGTVLGGAIKSDATWRGRTPAVWLNSVAIVDKEALLTFDTEKQKVTRKQPVPGLTTQPFATEPGRIFAEIEGALAAIDLVNGRIVWRCHDVPRVLAITVAKGDLLVMTADHSLAWLNRANGKIRGSTPLGGRPAAPPIFAGGKAFVLLANGTMPALRPTKGKTPDQPKVAPRPAAGLRTLHSPDGYSLDAPEGWFVSEQATRGAVSMGFRPNAESPRFKLPGASAMDRQLLGVSSYIAVLVVPAQASALAQQANEYLDEEKNAAKQGEFGLEGAKVGEKTIGGHAWTTISLAQVVDKDNLRGRFEKRVLLRKLNDRSNVWIELKTPSRYLGVGEKDLHGLAGSFRPEKMSDFTPSEEVQLAEKLVRAFNRGDIPAAAKLLSGPLAEQLRKKQLPRESRRLRLMMRASIPRGQRREVRVRIDSAAGTKFTAVTVSREAGRWVIIDLGELLK